MNNSKPKAKGTIGKLEKGTQVTKKHENMFKLTHNYI